MTNWKSLRNLALVGALFAATHTTQANHSEQVISSNGTTNIVERIDFPVGDIKDIVPAGDKYIIHANPIESLRGGFLDGTAKDALFVMEKDQNDRAFGRTFSDEITSVAYVPSLDFATWSYKTQANTNVMEIKQGSTALHAAGSITNFQSSGIQSNADLFAGRNAVWDLCVNGETVKHEFSKNEQGKYLEASNGGALLGDNSRRYAVDSYGVFVARDGMNKLSHYRFVSGAKQFTKISNLIFPLSMAKISTEEDDGTLLLGYGDGHIEARRFTTTETIQNPISTQIWDSNSLTSMSGTTNQTVSIASATTNEVVNVSSSLNILDRLTPNTAETGYRKVISDGDNTLLLSNIHSNYFYRIKKVR